MTSPLCHFVDGLQSNTSGANARPASSSGASEQRRLFGYAAKKQYLPSTTKKGKGKKESACTFKFVCLSSKAASTPPSSVKERTYLSNMGLGDSCITFNSQEHVYDYILEKYLQLSKAGRFELLLFQRGGGEDGGFHVIHPPHVAGRVKQLAGQAKIYIRPLQKDIESEMSNTHMALDHTEVSLSL